MAPDESKAAALAREVERLGGALRDVTDKLAMLLDAGFPAKGRSQDDKDQTQNWWEDHVRATQTAYSILAGEEDDLGWRTAHPGLFIPPHGPVKLNLRGDI